MKFAYIVNTGLTEGWAHSVQIMNMCKAFSETGAKVMLIIPNRSFLKEDPFEYYKIPKTFFIKKLPCIDLNVGSSHPFFYWLRFISFYISAVVFVWFNHFDILYSRDLYSAPFFPSIILELHSFPKNIAFVYKFIFSSPKKIIALTSFIKKRLIDAGIFENKILVLQSGVDLSKFNNFSGNFEIKGLSQKDFVYGYIGTLRTMGMEKGVADGLRALTLLPPDYKFLVVGGEKYDVEFYKRISLEFGVSDRVIFTGKVAYSDISKYAAKCDCFVAPFPENKHYNFYMSPLKIFEYMASKKSIIATSLPSIKEVLTDGENAILIPPDNPQVLANAIIRLKENPEFGKKIADQAFLDVSEKYTWKIRAEKIISFIKYAGKK
jgi:glycosyltransferase involved in cell wall biosynthesis